MPISQLTLVSCSSGESPGGESGSGPLATIHVNQVALERSGPKHAVVAVREGYSMNALAVLTTDGEMALEAEFEASFGFDEWDEGQRHYRADFTPLSQDGAYVLEARLNDGSRVKSAPFRVAEHALFDLTIADVYAYFTANRNTSGRDRAIPVIDTDEKVDVFGGWNDAGGETGKYLSHLTYSNYFPPQQASMVAWSMLASFEQAEARLKMLGLRDRAIDEAFWGADYLHRMLSEEGYFYMTVFDRWGQDENRWITGYEGIDGVYTPNYRAAFRAGAGMAIAALARAARLAETIGDHGEFSGERYLADAERAFAHLLENNPAYCDDGRENIIDDYTALMAAVELYRTTANDCYLRYAGERAASLGERLTPAGFFLAGDGERPYFHAVEAGLPLVALLHYFEVEKDSAPQANALSVVRSALEYQLELDAEVPNPFGYPRQNFQTFDFEAQTYTSDILSGFFVPHANETGYWWQGENARLASLAAAASLAWKQFRESENPSDREFADRLEVFAQQQFDWLLGKNPYGLCMLYGFGVKNPDFQLSGGAMVKGGISNGITGRMDSAEGRGIDWLADTEHGNWRWVEQWTPHGAWYLYASAVRVAL